MTSDHYFTIEQTASAEYKDRGSRFLAYLFPINSPESFKQQLQSIKKEHSKAVHHCFAYRLGTDGNTFRSSDDGEPSGTAGKPILGQIDSKQLTDVAVVVVRYFGGTLLGVPGLINAYKSAAALAIQMIPAVKKAIRVNYLLQFDYTNMNNVMQLVKNFDAEIIKQEAQLFCDMQIGLPIAREDEFLGKMNDHPSITFKKM